MRSEDPVPELLIVLPINVIGRVFNRRSSNAASCWQRGGEVRAR